MAHFEDLNLTTPLRNAIDDLGFESFTFKKLATKIGSTEASIYRYFESKHHLLTYNVLWYWGWMEYRIVLGLTNSHSAEDRLRKAVKILTERVEPDGKFSHINEVKLNKIALAESSKIYYNKNVDDENYVGTLTN